MHKTRRVEMEAHEFKNLIAEALEQHYGDHSAHHAWIQARIEAEERRRDFYASLATTLTQWSLSALLGAGLYWLQGHLK